MKVELTELKREWVDSSIPMIQQIARGLGNFTSDDIRDFKSIPKPAHPNWWGVAIAQMKNHGMIQRIGSRKSTRHEANGRWIAEWRVIQ